MIQRLLPTGLRAQLAAAIVLVTAVAIGASFLALYSGTTARLRSQIDAQLRTQAGEWRQFTAGADLITPAAVERAARRFIAAQRYHAEALVTAVQVNGGRTVRKRSRTGRPGGRTASRRRAARTGLFGAPHGPLDRDRRRGRADARTGATDRRVTDERSGRCASPTRSRLWRRHSRVCAARL